LWVNGSTGDDAYTRQQIISGGGTLQWATIGRAVYGAGGTRASPNASEAAQAGDVVDIAAGIYWEGDGANPGNIYTPILNSTNSGTSPTPIIFRGSPSGITEIRASSGSRGPTIGAYSKSYIYWHRFYVDDYYSGAVAEHAAAVLHSASHCRITGCVFKGHNGSYYWGQATFESNYRVVGMEWADDNVVADCKIFNVKNAAGNNGGQNDAALMTYSCKRNIFEHLQLTDPGSGIFLKGSNDTSGLGQTENTVRFCKVSDSVYGGIRILGAWNSRVYQNLLASAAPQHSYWFGFGDQGSGSIIANNTVVAGTTTPLFWNAGAPAELGHYNNVFVRNSGANMLEAYNTTYDQSGTWDRNLWYNTGGDIWNAVSWATWQTANDPNGVFAAPAFQDAANGDYRLSVSSPAVDLGRDVLNLLGQGTNTVINAGCYITGDEVMGPRISLPEA